MDKDPPRAGEQLRTPTGQWLVKELILLGRVPLHYAVRVVHTDAAGSATTLVMSAAEWRAVLGHAQPPTRSRGKRR